MLYVPWSKKWLAWSIDIGTKVLIGLDPFVGNNPSFKLSTRLIQHLHSLKVYTLAHINHTSPYNVLGSRDWLAPCDLDLEGGMETKCESYILMLRCSGVSLRNEEDIIAWPWNHSLGFINVKSAYDSLVDQNLKVDQEWWYREIGNCISL